jgi:hypothetical protein
LTGADLAARALDLQADPPPGPVAGRVAGLVAEQVLVVQLVHDLRERGLELVDAVGVEGAAAAHARQLLEHLAQLGVGGPPALADHVDGRVVDFGPALHVREAGAARLVLAVREDHEHLAALAMPEELHRAQEHVVEGGASPGGEAVHRAQAGRDVGLPPREREHVVVEGEEGELVVGAEGAQEGAHGLAHLGHGVGHAAAHVHRDHHLAWRAFADEVAHGLGGVVLEDAEVVLAQPAHEAALAVGDDGDDLDHVHVGGDGEGGGGGGGGPGRALRAQGHDAARAAFEVGHRPQDVHGGACTRVPLAFVGRAFADAERLAVDAEGDARDAAGEVGTHLRAHGDEALHALVGGGGDDAEVGGGAHRRVAPEGRRDEEREKGRGRHGRGPGHGSVTGASGPRPTSADT